MRECSLLMLCVPCAPTQELLNDVHCIIEAMIGRGADVALKKPEMQGSPPVLLGDPDRVRGILLNLSTNAAKFTKKGHITMKVGLLNRSGAVLCSRPHFKASWGGTAAIVACTTHPSCLLSW